MDPAVINSDVLWLHADTDPLVSLLIPAIR